MRKNSEYEFSVTFVAYAVNEESARKKLKSRLKDTKDVYTWNLTLEEVTSPSELEDRDHLGCPNYPNCDEYGCGSEMYGHRD